MPPERENIGRTRSSWEAVKKVIQRKWTPLIIDVRYKLQSDQLFLEFKKGLKESFSDTEATARYAEYNRQVDDLWMRTYFIEKNPEEQNEILTDTEKDIADTQSKPLFLLNDDARQDLETDIRLAIKMRNYLRG
ncbi:hypothetical protein HYU94_03765 [Candidatus Daviesbacteria bacterium]|nr:hypothetical protein [Candidatus Daviesbacteria bacterium]